MDDDWTEAGMRSQTIHSDMTFEAFPVINEAFQNPGQAVRRGSFRAVWPGRKAHPVSLHR